MAKQYRVIGQCAHVKTMTPSGRMTRMLMKGAILPDDVSPDQIAHLLSVKLIAELAPVPAGATPAAAVDDDTVDPAVQETLERRAVARSKLPADGSLPDGRSGQAVWVEYLAAKGYDYNALKDQDKADLVELAKNAT